jgi:hypothetical protein
MGTAKRLPWKGYLFALVAALAIVSTLIVTGISWHEAHGSYTSPVAFFSSLVAGGIIFLLGVLAFVWLLRGRDSLSEIADAYPGSIDDLKQFARDVNAGNPGSG